MDQERILILGEILLEITVMMDIKCPPVKNDLLFMLLLFIRGKNYRDKRGPVTMAWHILRLQMEERPPIWSVAANIMNKLSQTADKGRSSRLGVGAGTNNPSP